MKLEEISKLLDIEITTLKNWQNGDKKKLYTLLESLDTSTVIKLLNKNDKKTYLRILNNENYFNTQLDFERYLYPLLCDRDATIWKELAIDKNLSKIARQRSAYLYSYLKNDVIELEFTLEVNVPFFHKNKSFDGDGYAMMYKLLNGLDNRRYNLYIHTGSF